MVQFCDNGRDIACYTCANELCNNMSLAADSRTSNQPIPARAPDNIYVPIEPAGAAGLRVALAFLIAMLFAGRFVLVFLSYR
uniref:Uncharacterized protein n=1 Tax=Globodera rostochiensis TaxID=31243 RepID=A0A914IBQ5_GLORO